MTAQTTTLIELLGNGNLEAVAGLTSAADKGIMFTGPGTAGTFDLTAAARELLNDASYAAMRTTLGAQASLGFTPANKAGDTFNGVVNFRSEGTTQAQWGAGSNLGSFYTQNGYPAIAMVGPNGTTYLPSDAGWLLRNGDVTIDRGSLLMTSGVITSQFSGTGTRIRWGQGASVLSALGIDSNGAGQIALYGPAAITYFSGDGANLLRGSSYQISRGNLSVSGSLSKGSGTFEIDHPTDPFNKNLVHGFVESTEYMNLYRGMVDLEDGQMLVDIDAAFGMMDGTFAALNADVMVTALQAQYVPEKLWVEASPASGKFVIRSENSNSSAKVAWMISGRRQDAFIKNNPDAHTDADGRLIPEFDKED
ncbi:hypothetical protein AB664_24890 [Brucella anthropi]|uniref:Uncharacterized protein n=1 Tax=Brucella anthropi TaxID=529 RepID=A0A656Z8X0_BRUAN|nr:hypothetical protein AB664_24890 [Brucella anthropi]